MSYIRYMKLFLIISIMVLMLSGIIDLLLWVHNRFSIPCFTMTIMTFALSMLLLTYIKVLKNEPINFIPKSDLLFFASITLFFTGIVAIILDCVYVGIILMTCGCTLSWFALFIKDVED